MTAGRLLAPAVALTLALVLCGSAPARSARPSAFAFTAPVALTHGQNGGFEPGIQVDRYSNIFVAAHKARAEDGLAPDSQTSSGVRSASWVWTSTDGRHFHDLTPGGPYPASWSSWPGDEGSLAVDSTGNLYFVDTWVTDVSFTHWRAHGLGRVKVVQRRPDAPTGSPVDDRPWIAANSDGTVMLISNSGTGQVYPLANHGGQASGTGRITVYVSHDFGRRFNSIGYTLKDSGWCYPAADPRPGSQTWYVGCVETTAPGQDQSGAMYVFVSHNDETSWHRVPVGRAPSATSAEWPAMAVGSGGRAWMQVTISGNHGDVMHLFSSTNGGRTWRGQLIPWKGTSVPFSWMAVAANGKVGVGSTRSCPPRRAGRCTRASTGRAAGGTSPR
jgi:hypothetical protein